MKKLKKIPAQQRSQDLFNAIIESAARILPTLGYTRATTNKIANYAGVSIGSLYQYFPHKDAIFASLLERELNKQVKEISALVDQDEDKTLDEIIDFLVERFCVLYLGRKHLSRELFLNASKMGQVGEILYVRNQVGELLTQMLVKKNRMDPELAKKKVFVCINAFMGVIQTCSLLDEVPMSSDELRMQISSLLKAYLT